MEELFKNGMLGIGEQATDFLLLNGDKLPDLFKQDDVIFEYNQGNSNDCTIYSAMGAVSDLMNYEFSDKEIKELNELSYKRGRVRGKGWYVASAVKCVADRWNSNKNLVEIYGKVAYYRVDLHNDELVNTILDKGYTLCSGYQGNYKYNLDFTKDDKLDNSEFGEKTYGHAVSWRKVNGVRSIKDNYKGRSYNGVDTNIYEVIPSCSKLIDDNTYYFNSYLFTKVSEDNREELKRLEQFKTALNIAMEQNSKMRHLTNDTEYKNWLHNINEKHRKKMKDIEDQVILHS